MATPCWAVAFDYDRERAHAPTIYEGMLDMSWWVTLCDEQGNTVAVDKFSEGGTQVVGGSSVAELNITYNYSMCFSLVAFDLRSMDGKKASETTEQLADAVEKLGTNKDSNYWSRTPGNAGFALSILLLWAKQHPSATWRIS